MKNPVFPRAQFVRANQRQYTLLRFVILELNETFFAAYFIHDIILQVFKIDLEMHWMN